MTKRETDTGGPMLRTDFEKLLNERAALARQLRQLDRTIAAAKARGVEPVTRENVNTNWTMSFGLRIDGHRDYEGLRHALQAWHCEVDGSALDIVMAAMNAEAGRHH